MFPSVSAVSESDLDVQEGLELSPAEALEPAPVLDPGVAEAPAAQE